MIVWEPNEVRLGSISYNRQLPWKYKHLPLKLLGHPLPMGSMASPLRWILLISLACTLLISCSGATDKDRKADNLSRIFFFFFFFFCICDHYCVYLSNSLINLLLLLEKSISLDACKWCMGNNRSIVELTDIWELICGCRSTLCTWVTFQKVKCLCHPFTLTYFDKSPAGYKHSYTPKMIYNCFPP